MSFKSGFESRERERERERESQFNMAGGSEFQVRGAAVLNDRLASDVRRNGTHSSGTDDDRVFVRWSATRCADSDTAEMTSVVF